MRDETRDEGRGRLGSGGGAVCWCSIRQISGMERRLSGIGWLLCLDEMEADVGGMERVEKTSSGAVLEAGRVARR